MKVRYVGSENGLFISKLGMQFQKNTNTEISDEDAKYLYETHITEFEFDNLKSFQKTSVGAIDDSERKQGEPEKKGKSKRDK